LGCNKESGAERLRHRFMFICECTVGLSDGRNRGLAMAVSPLGDIPNGRLRDGFFGPPVFGSSDRGFELVMGLLARIVRVVCSATKCVCNRGAVIVPPWLRPCAGGLVLGKCVALAWVMAVVSSKKNSVVWDKVRSGISGGRALFTSVIHTECASLPRCLVFRARDCATAWSRSVGPNSQVMRRRA